LQQPNFTTGKKWLLSLLISVLVILLGLFNFHYHLVSDWTFNQKNSLSPATIEMLETISVPVLISSYTAKDSIKSQIKKLIKPYQYFNSQIQLEFIDPALHPELIRELGIQVDGELVIRLADKIEHLIEISEEKLSNAILKLSRQSLKTVYFISGHGERSFQKNANFDLSTISTILLRQGFTIKESTILDLPDLIKSTDLLVLAGPQSQLFSGEVDILIELLEQGLNFFWLLDPAAKEYENENLYGLNPLAEYFEIEFADGVIVDPQTQSLKLNRPDFAIISDYISQHPISSRLQQSTLFPQALSIDPLVENTNFKFEAFLLTSGQSWLETSTIKTVVKYDQNEDIAGPLILAISLERELTKEIDNEDRIQQQRIVVIGDGDFISNRYLANGGNMGLGLNIFNWLSEEDQLISISPRFYPDQRIKLSNTQLLILAISFFIILPILFLVTSFFIRFKRKQNSQQ
jgi:ABC-type uncharacterized transport system involved in gliding motility auxiliary subunit